METFPSSKVNFYKFVCCVLTQHNLAHEWLHAGSTLARKDNYHFAKDNSTSTKTSSEWTALKFGLENSKI